MLAEPEFWGGRRVGLPDGILSALSWQTHILSLWEMMGDGHRGQLRAGPCPLGAPRYILGASGAVALS